MTDNRRDGRAFYRYTGDGEVSLPGYLDARPSIVAPGDVFSIADSDEVAGPFEAVAPPTVAPESPVDPDATIAELLELIPADVRDDAPRSPKAAVVDYVDAYLRTHPTPPSSDAADTEGPNE